jgi:hypothetical protein
LGKEKLVMKSYYVAPFCTQTFQQKGEEKVEMLQCKIGTNKNEHNLQQKKTYN